MCMGLKKIHKKEGRRMDGRLVYIDAAGGPGMGWSESCEPHCMTCDKARFSGRAVT